MIQLKLEYKENYEVNIQQVFSNPVEDDNLHRMMFIVYLEDLRHNF